MEARYLKTHLLCEELDECGADTGLSQTYGVGQGIRL